MDLSYASRRDNVEPQKHRGNDLINTLPMRSIGENDTRDYNEIIRDIMTRTSYVPTKDTLPTRHGPPTSIHCGSIVRQRQHATMASDPYRRRVSWSEVHTVTVFDVGNDPTTTYRRTIHRRNMGVRTKGVTIPVESRDLPH